MASHSRGRVEYHSKTFHKGRRPRRRIASAQARKGVRRLRLILAIISGLAIVYGWFYREQLVERRGVEPPPVQLGR